MNPHRVALAMIAILCAACVSVAPASAPAGSLTPSPALPSVATTSSPTPDATATPTQTATPTEAPTLPATNAPSPSPTDSPSVPPTAAPSPTDASLEATLLTADDLPVGLVSQGVIEGSNFDIDQFNFDLFIGQEIISQVWQGTTGTINAVFDFRMRFNQAEPALSYLNAAEAVLSEEVASGLTETPIPDTVGENTSYYVGQGPAGTATVHLHNFLFTVDRVAAKVFIAGIGATYEEALPIAQAAAANIEAEFGDGGSGGALDELLTRVPSGYAELCDPNVTDLPEGAIASVFCELEGDVDRAQYTLFDSTATMDAAFADVVTDNQEEEDVGSCQTGPHVDTYNIGGIDAGQLICFDDGIDTVMAWTDEQVTILTFGATSSASYPELYQWWADEAGPVR